MLEHVVHGRAGAVSPGRTGTKAAARYRLALDPGETRVLRLRLRAGDAAARDAATLGRDFDEVVAARTREAEAFYATRIPAALGSFKCPGSAHPARAFR